VKTIVIPEYVAWSMGKNGHFAHIVRVFCLVLMKRLKNFVKNGRKPVFWS